MGADTDNEQPFHSLGRLGGRGTLLIRCKSSINEKKVSK